MNLVTQPAAWPDIFRAMTTDQISPDLAEELTQVLGEAATERWNAEGPGDPLLGRLRAMRERVERAQLTNILPARSNPIAPLPASRAATVLRAGRGEVST